MCVLTAVEVGGVGGASHLGAGHCNHRRLRIHRSIVTSNDHYGVNDNDEIGGDFDTVG